MAWNWHRGYRHPEVPVDTERVHMLVAAIAVAWMLTVLVVAHVALGVLGIHGDTWPRWVVTAVALYSGPLVGLNAVHHWFATDSDGNEGTDGSVGST